MDSADPENIIHAGFIPLTDCSPLVIAKELGFDRRHGFSLRLHREVSWANIRDKSELGIFDCAHMLAPMPLASSLGLRGRAPVPIIAPMALNLNGNAITVSNALYASMLAEDAESAREGGMAAAKAIAKVATKRLAEGEAPLTLGMVYPFSCHNYDLRCWLAAAGVDPDNDVNLVVVPPSLIAESLRAGRVDGFCVGAPWSNVAVAAGLGRIIATKSELWADSPEKVLGVRADWAEQRPELLQALIKALITAAIWLEDTANLPEAALLLASPGYVGAPEDAILRSLTGQLPCTGEEKHYPNHLIFHRHAANFPWVSHGVWLLQQMRRWRQLTRDIDFEAEARLVFRPDLYRPAASALQVSAPVSDFKSEGCNGQGIVVASVGPISMARPHMFSDRTPQEILKLT
ncbi:MAG: CmpA/NrtA family ABC transporter substrate-binding protein [Hyphomicrobiales bacterium]|nr:CmpA/NrtA family ABC transporter substrate-binding protein [Hyphomicrobiales bacterium]